MSAPRPLKRILLVEDDPDIQEVTSLLLSDMAGYDVKACSSAPEALDAAAEFAPDLILLDVMMPGLDGKGAFAAFREMPATAHTPVIFMTGMVEPREIAQYRQLGSLGVIPKPYDPDSLAETIQGMWERHQTARLVESRREVLSALRKIYAEELPKRLEAIEQAAASLQENGWDPQVATSLYDMAHRLAGSAAIYGFPEVSEAAQRIGRFASQNATRWTGVDPSPLLRLVGALVLAVEEPLRQEQPRRAS
jgi:CheY-like chemotaxis protein